MNFALFRDRNFFLFLTRESLSLFGTIFLNISLALYTLSLTGSAGKFASVLALGLLPHLLLGMFAGAIVDRLDKRKLLLWLDISRCAFLLLLFLYSTLAPITEPVIYITVLFFATCDLFVYPAFSTLLQSIVKKEDLTDANALDTTVVETVRILAPFLGTLVYSISGLGVVLLIHGLISFASAGATFFIATPAAEKRASTTTILQDVWAGLQLFTNDVRIASLVANGILTHIFLFPFVMVGFPFMIKQIFHGSDIDFGVVESIQTAGSLLSIFAVAFLQKRFSISENIGLGIVGLLVAVLPLVLLKSPTFLQLLHLEPLLVVLYFGGVSFFLFLMFGTYGVFFRTFYQQTIETAMLGRFVSIMAMLFAVGRLAGFHLYGFLFDSPDLLYPIVALGVGMVLKLLVHIPFLQVEQSKKASA